MKGGHSEWRIFGTTKKVGLLAGVRPNSVEPDPQIFRLQNKTDASKFPTREASGVPIRMLSAPGRAGDKVAGWTGPIF